MVGLDDLVDVIHEHAVDDALIPVILDHHRAGKADCVHEQGRKWRWELKSDDYPGHFLNCISEIVILAHAADRRRTQTGIERKLLLRSHAISDELG